MMRWMILIILAIASFQLYSQDQAKVVKMRGNVTAYEKGGQPFRLKVGTLLNEKTAVSTERSSFVRIQMNDGSLLNLGPNSKVVVNRLPESDSPGILSLVKGKLRAKIRKRNGKNKLFIRTKTASMGVRGTDFQVLYNPENGVTNTVTYSGEVAMLQTKGLVSVTELNRALSSQKVVSIRQGQFSFANAKISARATIPTKISPAQFHSMKRNRNFKESRSTGRKLKIRSIVPSTVSAKGFVKETTAIKDVVRVKMSALIKSPPPEGFNDKVSGKIAPPAGGYVDMKTGVYVSPPAGSIFDPTTGVYIPPADVGGFDPVSGGYIAPEGMTLTDDGKLKDRSGKERDVTTLKNPSRPKNSPNRPKRPPKRLPLLPPKIEVLWDDQPPPKPPLGRVRFHFSGL